MSVATEQQAARLFILAAIDAYGRKRRMSPANARTVFIFTYNLDKIDLGPWIKTMLPKLSCRSVARWRRMARSEMLPRLLADNTFKRHRNG